jgi:methylenetetrahydrofolate dehydrogenase (NADP+)/methenyltetrahydrofolate cyclohydrolase
MSIIDGKALAEKIRKEIKAEISAKGLKLGLAVVLVGNDPSSEIYVRNKKKACAEVGIESFEHHLSGDTKEADLLKLITKLNKDKKVTGILVQLPLPRHINEEQVILAIDPTKDVDGFHPINVGRLLLGRGQSPAPTDNAWSPRPCTPLGVMELIGSTGVDIKGRHAVVVGRSNIVGKPVAVMLLERHATVTVCHSRTTNLPEVIKGADILVAAIGRPEFIKGDWIKKGAVVIDVGINRLADGRMVGDVEFAVAKERAGFITPVPGGVGPMTIAMLLKNTLRAYETHAAVR